ncbi:MAG: T9SS type A sorting domain-containing protein [Cytophagaceae bacterium]|nr:MAG: T9SS type A sorting domain-containing protein [Cytophagaceae bacterium]
MQHFSILSRLGLLAAAVGLLSPSETLAQTAFTAGNYVVTRVGDGTAALSSAATAVYLLEYSPAGTLVQTVAIPTADASPNRGFTLTGNATTEGLLSRSADGRYLLMAGYNAVPGTASVNTTAAATTNRVVARVASSGTLNTTTLITDAFDASAVRSVASANGSAFYVVGAASGVRYVTLGSTGATTGLTATTGTTGVPANLRAVGLASGNLYVSTASQGVYGLAQIGTGQPTTTGQTITPLAGFPTAAGPSSYSFFFADLSTTVPGPDVVYVADDRSTTDGGIQKWSLSGSTWALNGVIGGNTSAALRGITGSINGSTVTLAAAGGGGLFVVTDNAGYNAVPSTATLPTAVATASTNTAFRGVALAPLATALAARPATALELGIYPNPATDVLTIALPGTSPLGHTAEVRDLLGRTVRAATLPASGEVSLTGLPAGTYLLTVDGTLTRRLTKGE